jgi:outer membrane protein OmpA-like peptidoglycan-associated protein
MILLTLRDDNTMKKQLIAIALAATLSTGCAGLSSYSNNADSNALESNASYLSDSNGNVVLSGSGDCVVNGHFNADMALPGCDPEAAAKADADSAAAKKAEMEKAAADKAASEQAAADQAAMDKAAMDKAAAADAAANRAAAEAATPIVMNLSGKALFASGSDELSSDGNIALQNLIYRLGGYSAIASINVIGHTDSQGGAAANKALSEKRAQSVANMINDSGVASDASVSVSGMGESSPIASNQSANGRQQNRRVEVQVRGVSKQN